MEAACEAGPGAAGGGGPDGAGAAGGEGGGGSIADTVAEMLACPCVADLRAGPCGPAFEGAFGCYVEQTEPGGGLGACAEAFARLQECMVRHPEEFQELAEYTLKKHEGVP